MALTFWYDFSSPYSYLAAMRMTDAARAASIDVTWRPLFLGAIFSDAGYEGSPNMAHPAKAAYMWTDLTRQTRARGLPFTLPDPFPQKSTAVARAASMLDPADRPAFSRAVYVAFFGHGRALTDAALVADMAREAGLDPKAVEAGAASPEGRQALFDATAEAQAAGVFGAPSFVTSAGDLYWGDDRLDQALEAEANVAVAL